MSQLKKATLLLIAAIFMIIIYGLIAPISIGGSKPINKVYGPDIHGVVCYKDARNSYGDPISCVKVG